jgi:hypothetical protein
MHHENVSEKKPISTKRGTSRLNNTKTTNNKEKIKEFNFKAAKNKEFFNFKFQMSFEQEKFSVTKLEINNIPKKH